MLILSLLKKILGDDNAREIKRCQSIVSQVNALEPEMELLSQEDIAHKTVDFKQRIDNGETLQALLPEAFAAVREMSRRVLGMRHFDVQIVGGTILHNGRIAEMKTGEGKTLVATLPAYLNALTGEGVHVVTVNDYLAKRDSEWMGQIYQAMGLSVGLIVHDKEARERQVAYAADITYGTNNEYGFDYLRDNMAIYQEQLVQRPLAFAIVDEVDSILIDEARTPLIISGMAEKGSEKYSRFARIAKRMAIDEDYTLDEKAKNVVMTDDGQKKVERELGVNSLYDSEDDAAHHMINALKAKALMKLDRDYVIKDGEIVIVDEFTGRLMFGRRYSDGLHQAIEAKEGVKVENESQTLASITFQNYFRMYKKLAGMTGTAVTEENEFRKIYGLDVIVIPANMPMVRQDMPDVVYRSENGKFQAVIEEVAQRHTTGQPVLVGTISIEKSERLSDMLKRRGIGHVVLNAKFHEKEAEIVAQAGGKGAVTIATNMAGRGTDIVLGEGIPDLGGLHIIGTERHESRRIDNQLRGRAGRQGDPGSTQFYLSLEDDLMRLFGADNIAPMMDKLGMDDSEPIENRLISKAIEGAQKKVENLNFDRRKTVLEYDDVLNQQREVIYAQRRQVLMNEELRAEIMEMMRLAIEDMVSLYASKDVHPEEWDMKSLSTAVHDLLAFKDFHVDASTIDKPADLVEVIWEMALKAYEEKEAQIGPEQMRELERVVVLRIVDAKWMNHLDTMDDLRQGIGLRAYGQKDPLIEYKFEGYEIFENMVNSLREDVIRYIFRVQVIERHAAVKGKEVTGGDNPNAAPAGKPATVRKDGPKVGRNDPCPCGSGKKYKKCCGVE
jgi:preprotein translocase subunit SecA